MKLRNKKSGIRGYIEYIMRTINPITGDTLLTVRYKDDKGITCYSDYETVAEFNDNWEDYKPKDPLIKDEKVRQAVRAWAELNKIDKVKHMLYEGMSGFCYNDIDENDFLLDFTFVIDDLVAGATYTITELCGDEQE